jgi:hypothetical protein
MMTWKNMKKPLKDTVIQLMFWGKNILGVQWQYNSTMIRHYRCSYVSKNINRVQTRPESNFSLVVNLEILRETSSLQFEFCILENMSGFWSPLITARNLSTFYFYSQHPHCKLMPLGQQNWSDPWFWTGGCSCGSKEGGHTLNMTNNLCIPFEFCTWFLSHAHVSCFAILAAWHFFQNLAHVSTC